MDEDDQEIIDDLDEDDDEQIQSNAKSITKTGGAKSIQPPNYLLTQVVVLVSILSCRFYDYRY